MYTIGEHLPEKQKYKNVKLAWAQVQANILQRSKPSLKLEESSPTI